MAVSFQLSDAPQVVHGCSCGRTSVAATIVLSCCVSLLCPSIVCFSLGLSVCLPHSSTGLSVCLPVSQFVYPPGCLSVCLAVCLSFARSFIWRLRSSKKLPGVCARAHKREHRGSILQHEHSSNILGKETTGRHVGSPPKVQTAVP